MPARDAVAPRRARSARRTRGASRAIGGPALGDGRRPRVALADSAARSARHSSRTAERAVGDPVCGLARIVHARVQRRRRDRRRRRPARCSHSSACSRVGTRKSMLLAAAADRRRQARRIVARPARSRCRWRGSSSVFSSAFAALGVHRVGGIDRARSAARRTGSTAHRRWTERAHLIDREFACAACRRRAISNVTRTRSGWLPGRDEHDSSARAAAHGRPACALRHSSRRRERIGERALAVAARTARTAAHGAMRRVRNASASTCHGGRKPGLQRHAERLLRFDERIDRARTLRRARRRPAALASMTRKRAGSAAARAR